MARLSNGVFGPLAGKLGGVVFGSWKGINYGRAYVVPANPQTPAQQTQRTKMGDTIAFARPILATILNRFYGFNLVKRSAMNQFVSDNISVFDGSPDYSAIKLGTGTIQTVDTVAGAYNSGTGKMTIQYDTTVEWDGLSSDKVCAVVFNPTTNIFDYGDTEPLRSAGTIDITLSGATAGDIVRAWLIAFRVVDGVTVASATPSYLAYTI